MSRQRPQLFVRGMFLSLFVTIVLVLAFYCVPHILALRTEPTSNSHIAALALGTLILIVAGVTSLVIGITPDRVQVTSGTIFKIEYVEAHTHTSVLSYRLAPMPMNFFHPEAYLIYYKDGSGFAGIATVDAETARSYKVDDISPRQ